jgi:hypothetical protein
MNRYIIKLTIEKTPDNELFWANVIYNGNLIICYAPTVEIIEKEIKIQLSKFEGLDSNSISFVRQYS